MRIEPLKAEYIPALCAMEQACFGQAAWHQGAFESELKKEDALFLCAFEGEIRLYLLINLSISIPTVAAKRTNF